jgi:hypothetical protein
VGKYKNIIIISLVITSITLLVLLAILYQRECTPETNNNINPEEVPLNINKEDNTIINIYTTVEIVKVHEGNVVDESCDGQEDCIVDLKIDINDKGVKDHILRNYTFWGSLDTPQVVPNTDYLSDNIYIEISSGTGNERAATLFSTKDTRTFQYCITGKSYILDSKYLIYQDCGSTGNIVETVSGISMLDLETNKITTIIKEEKSTTQDMGYVLVDITHNNLMYYKYTYAIQNGEGTTSVEVKTLDLTKYIK